MPFYTYVCKKCNNEFELLINFEQSNDKINCNNCKSEDVIKKFSAFSVGNKQKSCGPDQCASLGCDVHSCHEKNCHLG